MPRGKPRIKTAVVTLRVDPKIKAAAERAAKIDRRSLTNFIEILILNHCAGLEQSSRNPDEKDE